MVLIAKYSSIYKYGFPKGVVTRVYVGVGWVFIGLGVKCRPLDKIGLKLRDRMLFVRY